MIISTLSEKLRARSRDALILLYSYSAKGGFPGEGLITLNSEIACPIEVPQKGASGPYYGPDAPFWRTSMDQAIAEFGVIRPSLGNPPFGEEE